MIQRLPSVSIVAEGTLDLDEVDDWLERLIEEKGEICTE
ncbi:unnamed protein product [Rhodiola kirilowii]